jgi:hypothetical protein
VSVDESALGGVPAEAGDAPDEAQDDGADTDAASEDSASEDAATRDEPTDGEVPSGPASTTDPSTTDPSTTDPSTTDSSSGDSPPGPLPGRVPGSALPGRTPGATPGGSDLFRPASATSPGPTGTPEPARPDADEIGATVSRAAGTPVPEEGVGGTPTGAAGARSPGAQTGSPEPAEASGLVNRAKAQVAGWFEPVTGSEEGGFSQPAKPREDPPSNGHHQGG